MVDSINERNMLSLLMEAGKDQPLDGIWKTRKLRSIQGKEIIIQDAAQLKLTTTNQKQVTVITLKEMSEQSKRAD